jgi:prepilin-type N-terminal cleavage/methylation domain-containing protein
LLRSHREKTERKSSMKIKTSRNAGFTLVEIMIVVAIIGLLAAIAIPNFIKARATSQANACINNLRQLDGAIQQWALENNQGPSVTVPTPSTTLAPYLGRGSAGEYPTCPGGGTYTVTTDSAAPTCSLSTATPPHVLP